MLSINKLKIALLSGLLIFTPLIPANAQVFNPTQLVGGLTSGDCVKIGGGDNNSTVNMLIDSGTSCNTGTIPAVTGTGTPTIATGSTDKYGEVTAGASATSVIITFSSAKAAAPFCVVENQSQITSFAYAISTTAITITQTATSGNKIDYRC